MANDSPKKPYYGDYDSYNPYIPYTKQKTHSQRPSYIVGGGGRKLRTEEDIQKELDITFDRCEAMFDIITIVGDKSPVFKELSALHDKFVKKVDFLFKELREAEIGVQKIQPEPQPEPQPPSVRVEQMKSSWKYEGDLDWFQPEPQPEPQPPSVRVEQMKSSWEYQWDDWIDDVTKTK